MSIINYIERKTDYDCSCIICKILHQSYMKDLRHEIHNCNDIFHVDKITETGQCLNGFGRTIKTPRHILLVGDAGVGKTSIIQSIVGQRFNRKWTSGERICTIPHHNITFYDYPGRYRPTDFNTKFDECWIVYRSDQKFRYDRDIQPWKDKVERVCQHKPYFHIIKNNIKRNEDWLRFKPHTHLIIN